MMVVFTLEQNTGTQGITRRVLRGEGSPTTGDFTGFTNTAEEWTYASAGGGQGRGGVTRRLAWGRLHQVWLLR
jgi:hypothetical protein